MRRLISTALLALVAPLIAIAPSQANGLGGYAVIHPDGYVCGVIVGNDYFAGNNRTMTSEYMGCPIGSPIIFQTKPSPTGNVAGWHGRDVTYSNGVFRLASGTTIRDGIATDPNGRVWDTGSGETITPAPSSDGSGSSGGGTSGGVGTPETSTSSTPPSDSSSSTAPAPTPTPTPTPTPISTELTVSAGAFSPSTIQVGKQFTATFEISDRESKANLNENSVECSLASQKVRARLSAGNFTGGNWYCEILVPSSLAAGGYEVTAEVSGIGSKTLGRVTVVTENTAEWTPPADSTAPLNDYDDTYNRICLTLGWTECGIWTIYNSNGIQMNRVVGPYPLSKLVALGCQNSKVNLCGGDPKGFAVLNGLYSSSPQTGGTSSSSGSSSGGSTGSGALAQDTSVATSPSSSSGSSSSASTTPTAGRIETPVVQPVVATETSTVSSSPAATTNSSVTGGQTSPTTAITPSASPRPVSETSLEGQDEDPRGSLTVRRTDNGRYRMVITTNLESEDLVIRATKKGAKTIRFQVTLNEDGRAVILTTRNLAGYRLALIFGEDSLDSVRAS